jgi:hypothetical protein
MRLPVTLPGPEEVYENPMQQGWGSILPVSRPPAPGWGGGASVQDRANVNLGSIQRLLGRENRTTAEIYLHSIGEAEREAMKVFEQAG